MNLYIWKYAFTVLFALAESEEEAEEMVLGDGSAWLKRVVEMGEVEIHGGPGYFSMQHYGD